MGMLSDAVQVGRVQNLITFIEKLKDTKGIVELRAEAARTTYASGPLEVELVVVSNGNERLRSSE
jgi:uncharacterized protein (DUF3084 family)